MVVKRLDGSQPEYKPQSPLVFDQSIRQLRIDKLYLNGESMRLCDRLRVRPVLWFPFVAVMNAYLVVVEGLDMIKTFVYISTLHPYY